MPVMGTNRCCSMVWLLLELPHIAAVSSAMRFRYAKSVDQDQGDPPPPPYSGRGKPRKAPTLKERIPAIEAGEIIERLPPEAWQRVAWRTGTKGPLVKEFARIEVFRSGHRGAHLPVRGWLLGERPISKHVRKEDHKYYFAWNLDGLSLEELVELAHIRWVIERFYQDAKGELGLDHYERTALDWLSPPCCSGHAGSLLFDAAPKLWCRHC